jgi:hypothetical protein
MCVAGMARVVPGGSEMVHATVSQVTLEINVNGVLRRHAMGMVTLALRTGVALVALHGSEQHANIRTRFHAAAREVLTRMDCVTVMHCLLAAIVQLLVRAMVSF